jgi:two-component system sensor kinase FixL
MRKLEPGTASREILAAVAESSDDAIVVHDLDGTIVSWNRGAAQLYGWTADEAVGRPIALITPAERHGDLGAILPRIRAGGTVSHFETQRLAKDGRRLDVWLTLSPIASGGDVIGVASIGRDVSAYKRVERELRASQERWRAIVESTVDGIIVIDARGAIEAFNAAAERLFGYSAEEVIGRNVSMLMPAPFREQHDAYLARYLETGAQKVIGIGREVAALRKDGRTFPVHLSVGELSIDGQRKFTGIVHDLTARVEMEQRLREQQSLTRLGEMAAVVAHEVKNPLTGIRGAVQIIARALPEGSRHVAVIDEIVARIDALNDLLKDILLFARPPQLRPGPVGLVVVAEAVAELMRQDPALRELRIDVDGPPATVVGDVALLTIVLQNLAQNGAQAMHGRGVLRLSVRLEDADAIVTVADGGPGIPAEARARLFTPFFTTKARGTGLGLSTAKRIVEAHGGTISLDCPPEGGTVVTVRLPVAGPNPAGGGLRR